MSNIKEKILEDLIEKMHLLPETMGEVKEGEPKPKLEGTEESETEMTEESEESGDTEASEKAAALSALLGKDKDEEEEDE